MTSAKAAGALVRDERAAFEVLHVGDLDGEFGALLEAGVADVVNLHHELELLVKAARVADGWHDFLPLRACGGELRLECPRVLRDAQHNELRGLVRRQAHAGDELAGKDEFRLPTFNGPPIAGLPGGEEYDRQTPDAKQVKLNTYFTGKRVVEWCEYVYDFGDGWTHDVKLIAMRSEKERFKRRLLDGERTGPPEDCGGTQGYERMVHVVETGKDIWDEDPEELLTWLNGWRPDSFDLPKDKELFDR